MYDLDKIKDFLGVSDRDSDELINDMLLSAYQTIKDATGEDYTEVTDRAADEFVRLDVWVQFSAMRGIEMNAEFIEKRKTQILKILQYGRKNEAENNPP